MERIRNILKKCLAFILGKSKSILVTIKPSLIAICMGLIAGIIMMLIFNPSETLSGLRNLLIGVIYRNNQLNLRGILTTLHHSTTIILTGIAVVFAFRTGLFNIGASGQMMMGAYVTVHVGVLWSLPAPFHWIVGIFLGVVAGTIYGLIPGILKAMRNVNEVVTSIMLNWIAASLLVYLVNRNVLNPFTQGGSQNIQPTAIIPRLFSNYQLTIGFLIAIAMGILAHFLLYRTTLGFQLRASGFNVDGSKYAGMNTKRNIILSMGISGAFAGLAGALLFSNYGKTLSTEVHVFMEGFEGISVALLGLGEPIGAIIAGIFLSYIKQGGFYMQPAFRPEISDMIIGVIIYFTAISLALQLALKKYSGKIKTFIKRKHLTTREEDEQ